ncbi:MAG: DUF2067 domain-containing protein [Desulfurococcales archaeon]|nr:DUF2067 domain-containing protein [Desulfurococcales archaeon]
MAKKIVSIDLRRLVVKDPDKLVERLSKALKTSMVRLEVRGPKLIVELQGDSASVRTSLARLKSIVSELTVKSRRGLNLYPPNLIYREVELAVPLDVVAEVLKSSGYKAQHTSEGLETNAPLEEVLRISEAVANALESIKALPLTTSTRKAVTAASVVTGLPPEEVVERGLQAGVIVEEHDKVIVKGSWREAYSKLVKALEGETGGVRL